MVGSTQIAFLLCCLLATSGKTQSSGSGTISNYGIVCGNNVYCSDTGPNSARFYYVAPQDGQLSISGFADPGVITCCGTPYQMNCTGGFRKLRAPANIHNFSALSTTGFLDCISAGDSIEINFNGSFGTYGFNATVIPDPIANDAEPNDWFSDANSLIPGSSYSGHLRYGIYAYDNYDFYTFIAPSDGQLTLQVYSEEEFNIQYYTQDSIYRGGDRVNMNPYTYVQSCLAEGDKIFLLFSTAFSCTGYQFDVEFTPPIFGNDVEPNNNKESAIATNDIFGCIGHGLSSPVPPDASDFYTLPYLTTSDNLDFEVELSGGQGQALFRIRSLSFSGFSQTLGFVSNSTANYTFNPPFDDQFFLEVYASNGSCGDYRVTLDGCVKELTLTGTETDIVGIESDSLIISTQQLKSTALVDYDAKNEIRLESPFEVELGAVLHAFIDGCDD